MRIFFIIIICIFCFVSGMTYKSVDAQTEEPTIDVKEQPLWDYELEEQATILQENEPFIYTITSKIEKIFNFLTTILVDFLYQFASLFF